MKLQDKWNKVESENGLSFKEDQFKHPGLIRVCLNEGSEEAVRDLEEISEGGIQIEYGISKVCYVSLGWKAILKKRFPNCAYIRSIKDEERIKKTGWDWYDVVYEQEKK